MMKLEVDKTLRANVPRVSAMGAYCPASPTLKQTVEHPI